MSPVVIENHSVVFPDSQQPSAQCLKGKTQRERERDEHMGQQSSRGHIRIQPPKEQCPVKKEIKMVSGPTS